jgi:glycosyltransferase involved in cell wall biosynthesis
MSAVRRRVPGALAVIVGEGPERERLERLVGELVLGDVVRLAGAVYDQEEVGRLLLFGRVGVMPAAAGLFVVHAFGYGLPVVIGNDGASHGPEAELVVSGRTGARFPDGDADGLAGALCRLLGRPEEREWMAANCRRVVAERHNAETMAAGLMEAVDCCVGGGRDVVPEGDSAAQL